MVNKVIKTQFSVILTIILLVVLGSSFQAVAGTNGVSAADYKIFSQAKQALDNQQFEIAKTLMQQYFQEHQNRHPYAYELYGHVLLLTDATSLALEVYKNSVAEYPEHLNLIQNLAVAYSRCNYPLDAAKTYLQVYELGGRTKPQIAFAAAVWYGRASEYGQAITVLQGLLNKGEVIRPDWILLLGQCHLQQQDSQLAINVLLPAAGQFPNNEKIWRMLAFSYYHADEKENAAAAYQIANAISAESAPELAQLGALLLNLGATYSGATIVTADALELQDRIVYQLIKSGDLEVALNRALALQRQQPSAAREFRIGRILGRMGRLPEAEKVYLKLAGRPGEFQVKAQWALVLLSWDAANWHKVYQRLLQLERLNLQMKFHITQLIEIVKRILPPEG